LASTLVARRQDFKLVERVAHLEEIIQGLRANQNAKISFGNITLDGTGTTGIITVGNSGSIIVGSSGSIIIGNITISSDSSGHGSIVISDGTNNRVLMGYQAGGF